MQRVDTSMRRWDIFHYQTRVLDSSRFTTGSKANKLEVDI